MEQPVHSIQLAARLTGLSPFLIRIWEQRYRAVSPTRTATNRRVYSEKEIERLRLLRDATRVGHSIGQVAQLSDERLRELARNSPVTDLPAAGSESPQPGDEALQQNCLAAIQQFDAAGLDRSFRQANAMLGAQGTLVRLVAPLAQSTGDLWRAGRLTAAHEHFASAMVRSYLSSWPKPFGSGGPAIVVATPAGQLHELGALLVTALAGNLGWQVTHLGASLPASEIALAAGRVRARAVALSLVYPEDDAALPRELTALRETLPADTALIVGGRAMPAYRDTLVQIGAILVGDLAALGSALEQVRHKPATASA